MHPVKRADRLIGRGLSIDRRRHDPGYSILPQFFLPHIHFLRIPPTDPGPGVTAGGGVQAPV
jgi:hypothetical protein